MSATTEHIWMNSILTSRGAMLILYMRSEVVLRRGLEPARPADQHIGVINFVCI